MKEGEAKRIQLHPGVNPDLSSHQNKRLHEGDGGLVGKGRPRCMARPGASNWESDETSPRRIPMLYWKEGRQKTKNHEVTDEFKEHYCGTEAPR